MPWYKDRDFPEVKQSNADIVAVIENPKQLERVILEYNCIERQRDTFREARDKWMNSCDKYRERAERLEEILKMVIEVSEPIVRDIHRVIQPEISLLKLDAVVTMAIGEIK